jgi:hypothetical protein
MKVKELIEKLQGIDQELEVYCNTYDLDYEEYEFGNIGKIYFLDERWSTEEQTKDTYDEPTDISKLVNKTVFIL